LATFAVNGVFRENTLHWAGLYRYDGKDANWRSDPA